MIMHYDLSFQVLGVSGVSRQYDKRTILPDCTNRFIFLYNNFGLRVQ